MVQGGAGWYYPGPVLPWVLLPTPACYPAQCTLPCSGVSCSDRCSQTHEDGGAITHHLDTACGYHACRLSWAPGRLEETPSETDRDHAVLVRPLRYLACQQNLLPRASSLLRTGLIPLSRESQKVQKVTESRESEESQKAGGIARVRKTPDTSSPPLDRAWTRRKRQKVAIPSTLRKVAIPSESGKSDDSGINVSGLPCLSRDLA